MAQPQRNGPRRRTEPRRRVDRARRVAYDVVHAVSTRDAYANLALTAALREHRLAGRDAGFATELVHGTLRRMGGYDRIVSRCVDRPLARLDTEVLDVLRLGTHQLLGMRVPRHAAVATSVDLARSVAGVGPSKLVNAVLRRVGAKDVDAWTRELAPAFDADPAGHLAAVHFHPRWVVEAFHEALGTSWDDTAALLAADNAPPRVTLAAWPGRSEPAELPGTPGRWSPYAVTLDEGTPADVPAVAEGRAGVQDEGSQLAALALADAPLDGPDRLWLDACAGPGGKAALLTGLAGERSARVLAAEIRPHRARLVANAVGSSAGRLGVVCADGTVPAWRDGVFDRVIVDVPCTGLGALRRRPEARWRRRPEEVEQLHPLQVGLLRSALEAVRPGGVVAYVTCSPHVRETREVVGEVLAERSDVVRLDARQALPGVTDLGPGPDVQLWPHRHGTDAMFVALLSRR